MDCLSFLCRFVSAIIQLWPKSALESDHGGNTALHLVCDQDNVDLDEVREVIECQPQLCRMKNKDKIIPLHIAVMRGKDDLVRELLSACPDSIKELTSEERTVFHLAAQCSLPDVFEVLWEEAKKLDKDYLLYRRDCKGNSLLHYAVSNNQLRIVEMCLLDRRWTLAHGFAIWVNTKNNEGDTAMDLCDKNLDRNSENRQIGHILSLASQCEPSQASETNTVHLAVHTIFITLAFGVICALPSFFPKEGWVVIALVFEFKDALYGELPLIFYLLFFITVLFTTSISFLIVILFSLHGRTFMLLGGISTFCLYFLLTRNFMPKFSVRAGSHLVPSYSFMWVLVAVFIFIGALIIQLVNCLISLSYNIVKLLLRKVASMLPSNKAYNAQEIEMDRLLIRISR